MQRKYILKYLVVRRIIVESKYFDFKLNTKGSFCSELSLGMINFASVLVGTTVNVGIFLSVND